MNKINWDMLEQWAIAKYNRFGGEDWLDLVMWVVAKRVRWEHGRVV